MGGWDIIIMQI